MVSSVIANLGKDRVMFIESVEQPIYILFFSLAGAKLNSVPWCSGPAWDQLCSGPQLRENTG